MRRDFCGHVQRTTRVGHPEIKHGVRKPAVCGLFATFYQVFEITAFIGWRRSADRARLYAHSLLTGNFTGKSSLFEHQSRALILETAAAQRHSREFPTRINREDIFPNREKSGSNRVSQTEGDLDQRSCFLSLVHTGTNRTETAPASRSGPSIRTGKIAFLFDLTEGRKARRPFGGLYRRQIVEPLKNAESVLAQARRDGRAIRKMLDDGIKPNGAAGEKSAGAGGIGEIQHALEFVRRSTACSLGDDRWFSWQRA